MVGVAADYPQYRPREGVVFHIGRSHQWLYGPQYGQGTGANSGQHYGRMIPSMMALEWDASPKQQAISKIICLWANKVHSQTKKQQT